MVLHQAGQTVAQIAKRFGFHHTTVARHLKQAGETLRTNPADPAFQERVRQAYAEFGTVKHTAQKLGVSKDAVRKVVRGG
ncbi:Homeodomain-like domain protein [Actinomyces naeslundii]|nr:Homeodomain-like domain protein [Actinomyces naeslundii]